MVKPLTRSSAKSFATQSRIDDFFTARVKSRRDRVKLCENSNALVKLKSPPSVGQVITCPPSPSPPEHHDSLLPSLVEYLLVMGQDGNTLSSFHRSALAAIHPISITNIQAQINSSPSLYITDLLSSLSHCRDCDKPSSYISFCSNCTSQNLAINPNKRPIAFNASSMESIKSCIISASKRGLDAFLALLTSPSSKYHGQFAKHGGDALFLFRFIAERVSDPDIRSLASSHMKEIMSQWDQHYPDLLSISSSHRHNHILCFAEAVHAKLFLDSSRPHVLEQHRAHIRESLRFCRLSQLLAFCPLSPTPLMLAPGICPACLRKNPISASNCVSCRRPSQTALDYQSLFFALVWAGLFRNLGLDLACSDKSCSVEQVLVHMSSIRPYKSLEQIGLASFKAQSYFITHLLFVMSNWGEYRLDSILFAPEITFIISNIPVVIRLGDPEIIGEYIQCLRIMGADESDVHVQRGVAYLLQKERSLKSKGSWIKSTRSFYQTYHSIYCALIGLNPMDIDPVDRMPITWRSYFQ
uniref:Uncharacterized protein n=1 Tax=Spongospora subterranea TaxID=70186 RepID=A0A0H5R4B1_9EUKA|eukprot:CRZ08741.1 hypothetical protein [Spongospora subterranea]